MKLDMGLTLNAAHWCWGRPHPAFDAPRKRGEAFFAALAASGIEVTMIETGANASIPLHKDRWTIAFLPLPTADVVGILADLADRRVCMIFDVHFPIMDMENAIGADRDIIDIIDNKDRLLANIIGADAVVVPHETWAADLVGETGANVFYLPDLETDDQEAIADWAVQLTVIANSGIRKHRRNRALGR